MSINADAFINGNSTPPPHLLPWLVHQDSLTEKLKTRAGDACLQILAQCWEPSDWWDRSVLGLSAETVLHREIVIKAQEKPCWYARTIIPSATYEADKALFDRLQQESLGDLIFKGTQIKRVFMTTYPICNQSIEYYWLPESMRQGKKEHWVRLSEFSVHGIFPFFLIEILLPELESYL